MNHLWRLTGGVVLLLSSACATSRTGAPESVAGPVVADDSTLSAAAVRQDLDALYGSLKSAHYDLFVYRNEEEYDAAFRKVRATLNGPRSRLALVRAFQPLVAFGRIGHARIDFPVPDYVQAAGEGQTILPFDIRVLDGRVFVAHSYLPSSRLTAGVELLSLGGRPVRGVVEETARYVSGERPYMVHAQLERFFPRWYWLDHPRVSALRIEARDARGSAFEETIDGLPIGAVEPLKSEWTEALNSREVRILDADTAYLRPGPFYDVDGADSMDTENFARFIDDAFGQIQGAKVRRLIVDLRDNPGGDNSFSDLLVARFASRPFRFSNDFSIKASPEIRAQFERAGAQGGRGILGQMSQAIAARRDGEIVHIELPWIEPRLDRFDGRVFVLINRHSYSNAASLAGLLQDYGFATLLGEETADLPTSYASSAQFTLPNSALVVTFPKGYFVRPSGDVSLRGVVPDVVIDPSTFLAGHDAVLAEALAHIAGQP